MSDLLKVENKVTQLVKEWKNVAEGVDSFEIENDKDYEDIVALIQEIKIQHKDLEEERKSVTKPLNDTIKRINSWFKPATEMFSKMEAALKKKLKKYDLAKLEQQRKILEAAVEQGDRSALMRATETAPPSVQGVIRRKVYKWRIVDISKIPDEFFVLDESAIDKIVKKEKDKANIPGIEVYSEFDITTRIKP